jgi:thioredoxin reductase (NADPH)
VCAGARPKKLGVPGEDAFYGRGLGYCAYCEGGQFAGKAVAVCGGGDAGITDALYLARIASRVTVIEVMPELKALTLLLKRVEGEGERIQVLCNSRVEAIVGDTEIRGIEVSSTVTQEAETVPVEGVLVRIGWEPETEFLRDIVPLDSQGYVLVNDRMETDLPGVFAAGDIRHGSPMQVSTAVGDGTVAAISAQTYLRMAEFECD